MKSTVYQIWRYNPLKEQWFLYKHIPDCPNERLARSLLEQHRAGTYKGNQFKDWMREDQFKVVRCDRTVTDCGLV